MDRLRPGQVITFAGAALFILVVAALLLARTSEIDHINSYTESRPSGPPVQVTVKRGQDAVSVGQALESAGVIESAEDFPALVSKMGFDGLMRPGAYEFAQGSPLLEVVYRLRHGEVSIHSVTVYQGDRREQIADALAEQGVPRENFLAATASPAGYEFDFLAGLPPGATLEGYLYPGTYNVFGMDNAESMVAKMLQAFEDSVPNTITDRAPRRGLTPGEAVTLASIIEREALLPQEKPIMAQVFETRLEMGMPLEADPTVQYAIADTASQQYWDPIAAADVDTGSPYNTYEHDGLPPGPICNPDVASILAVVQPAITDYLFFVARPDGSHAFARTFEEHKANIGLYLNGGGQ